MKQQVEVSRFLIDAELYLFNKKKSRIVAFLGLLLFLPSFLFSVFYSYVGVCCGPTDGC